MNKTIENNGIKITIDKIVIDNNTLAVTSIIEGDNLHESRGNMGNINLNGQCISSFDSKDKKIGDNKLMVVTYGNISDVELPKVVDIDLNIVWVEDIKCPWDFKFKVSKVDKLTNFKVIYLNNTLKIPDNMLKIEKLVISPLGNTLNYTGIYDKLNENMRAGNGIYDFIVMDDKGRNLEINFGGESANKEKYDGKIEMLNDLSNVKSLTVVPIFKEWGTKTKEINKNPYNILQTTINSIDFSIPQEVITKSRPITSKEKSDAYAVDNVIHVFNIDKSRAFNILDKLIN